MSAVAEIDAFVADHEAAFTGPAPWCVQALDDRALHMLAASGNKGCTEARHEIRTRMTARLSREVRGA